MHLSRFRQPVYGAMVAKVGACPTRSLEERPWRPERRASADLSKAGSLFFSELTLSSESTATVKVGGGMRRILLWLSFPAWLWCQVDRATLTGTVTDSSGAVVPGARVVAESQDTGWRRETQTNEAGVYVLPALPIGTYTVTVSMGGFATVRVENLRLGVGDTRTLDVQLEPAPVETQVVVETAPLMVETATPTVGSIVTFRHIREIPLNGRHWASLMALAPGAINTGDGSQQTIRFVGRARDDNNWTYDGLDATGVKDPRQEAALRLIISTEALAEFRVNSTLYTAESGAGAGAQINLVSRSGTNEFHASLFEFVRNDVLDARNPFDVQKQPFRLNQFGGSAGGPIIRNRSFFFASYEGLRQRVSQTMRGDVPSLDFRTRALARSPALKPILDAYPIGVLKTTNPDIERVEVNRSQAWKEDSGTLRIDHRFTDRHTIFGRFNVDDGFIRAPRSIIAVDLQDTYFRPSNFVLNYQAVLSPSVINEARAGYNRSPIRRFSYGPLPHTISVPGFMTLNGENLLIEGNTSYSVIDNLSWTAGRHSLKFGVELRRIHVNVADPAIWTTSVTYASRSDFLANKVDSFSVTGTAGVLGARRWWALGFVQDDIKIRPNLTLNLGARYEYYTVPHEVRHRERVFDMWECKGFCPPGTPWFYPDRNNIDPRVGLAWSPSRLGGKTVIRTGFGIYHGPGQNDDVNAALDNMAERYSLTAREVPQLVYPIDPFLPLAKAEGITPRSLQRDRRDLYSMQWGLSIQQQLPARFLLQLGYVGNGGRKLFARTYINVIDPTLGRRPLVQFGRIDEKRNDGTSNFHGLQVSLHRPVGRGLTWQTEYMWSHCINDGNLGGGEGNAPQNVACRHCDRGNSPQDIRHTMTSNWVWELPVGPGQRFWNRGGLLGRLLEGWQLSGIWTARTGRALNITVTRSSKDLPDGNTANQRPDIVPGIPMYPPEGKTFARWLNLAAFAVPPAGRWGNAGRHIARGPGLVQVDVALQKRTRFQERHSLIVRAEAFNLFNRVQAGDPGTNISTANFGIILSGLNRTIGTGTARQLQFALRYEF